MNDENEVVEKGDEVNDDLNECSWATAAGELCSDGSLRRTGHALTRCRNSLRLKHCDGLV